MCLLSMNPPLHTHTHTHTLQQGVLGTQATSKGVQSIPVRFGSLNKLLTKHSCNSTNTKDARELTEHTQYCEAINIP